MDNKRKKMLNTNEDDNDDDDNDEDLFMNDKITKEIIEEDIKKDRLIPARKKRVLPFSKSSSPPKILESDITVKKASDPLNDYLKSYFFTKSIVEEYSIRIESQLTDKMIMNIDDIYEYFKDLGTSPYYISVRIIQGLLSEDICSNIDSRYMMDVFKKTIEQPHNYREYDLAFMINIKKPKDISSVISIIVVKKGECFKFQNAYVLNLICSRKCESCGNIMMGLYLYSILCHPSNKSLRVEPFTPITLPVSPTILPYYGPSVLHIGLLEISGGYKNISGLCLYTKFGFTINTKLSGHYSNCFGSDDNIAMIKRFKTDETLTNEDTFDNILHDVFNIEHEKSKIIEIVNKTYSGYNKHIICKIKDKSIQIRLALLYNELKNTEKKYGELIIQSKWPINKIDNDLTPEFSTKLSSCTEKLNEIRTEIHSIEIEHTSGGYKAKYILKKHINKLRTNKKRTNKKRTNKKRTNKKKN